MKNKVVLFSAILGTQLIFLITVLGGANFPNYSHASQFISELGAFGAPNARMLPLLLPWAELNYSLERGRDACPKA